jgi:hypothetical protein
MLRRAALPLLLSLALALPLSAQQHGSGTALRDRISDLFRFGDCAEPLCLNSSINSASGHGDHYIGSTVNGTNSLIGFLSGAIAQAVSNVPISTATSGITFRIVNGVPEATSSSAGPIFGERVQTLGKGRFLIGANVTGVEFNTVRGVPLNDVAFTFTHQNVCRVGTIEAGCPGPFPGDTALGSPAFENDVIEVNTSLDLRMQVGSLYFTYGLLDRVDIGVGIPLVRVDLTGGSLATVIPLTSPSPHFFGTSSDPLLQAGARMSGTETGLGDIAARVKVNLGGSEKAAFGLLTEARFPTGDEDRFLGTGETAVRVLAIASARYGTFSPHLNGGYLYRTGKSITDAIVATVGFDQLVSSRVTLAADLITQFQVGTNPLVLPGRVDFTVAPLQRSVRPTNIPNRDDDIIDGSLGFKFLTGGGITVVTNAMVPLNNGGIRGNLVWTTGLEYNF